MLNTTAATAYMPDLDAVPEAVWRRCQVLFLCSPGIRPGGVALAYLRRALELAERYDFVIAADECYTEIYLDEGAPRRVFGRLHCGGHSRFERCVVFHSLSKRSSLPDCGPALLRRSADHEAVPPLPDVSWECHGGADATRECCCVAGGWHAVANRRLYQEKFDRVLPILAPVMKVERPAGAFYLWTDVGGMTRVYPRVVRAEDLTVLPGSYLAGLTPPGRTRVRAGEDFARAAGAQCVEARADSAFLREE